MRRILALSVSLVLAGCSMAPSYRPPAAPTAPAYKEMAGWTIAAPRDGAPRAAWWQGFGDPTLDDLEARAEAASPTIAAAVARYDQATAPAAPAPSNIRR